MQALLQKCVAEVEMCLAEVPVDGECLSETGDRLVDAAQRQQRVAAVGMAGRMTRCFAECLVHQRQGRIVLPALVCQQAHEVQRIRVSREAGEDLPVQCFGLREPSGLVLRDGRLQGVAASCGDIAISLP